MKLKKILAVALAATTALSSGVAYDMLGSANVAKAAPSLATTSTTFTTTETNDIKYGAASGTASTADAVMTWQFTEVKNSDGGLANEVKLISVAPATPVSGNYIYEITVPANPNIGDNKLYDGTNATTKLNGNRINVTGVELDASSITDGDRITKVDISALDETIKTLKIENFDNGNVSTGKEFSLGVTSSSFGSALKTIDVSGSYLGYNEAKPTSNELKMLIDGANASNKLTTLDISSMANDVKTDETKNNDWGASGSALTLTSSALKKVDVSGNKLITALDITTRRGGTAEPAVINISDMDGLTSLRYNDAAAAGMNAGGQTEGTYNKLNNGYYPGARFITDGSTETTELDLSGYSMSNVYVNYANITGFKAPSEVSGGTLAVDVANNYITSLDLSACKGALTTLTANNNKLMDVDLAGQDKLAGSMDLSDNFLTSLDISDCASGIVPKADGNYIPSANFEKGDLTGKSISNQQEASVDGFTVLGDGGLSDGDSDSKAYVKLGGTANVIFAIGVVGAPEGFVDRLAETITWTEANTSSVSQRPMTGSF